MCLFSYFCDYAMKKINEHTKENKIGFNFRLL